MLDYIELVYSGSVLSNQALKLNNRDLNIVIIGIMSVDVFRHKFIHVFCITGKCALFESWLGFNVDFACIHLFSHLQ